jgi:predicted O-methyltransferase YrrM
MQALTLLPGYIRYLMLANSRHGTHSPFVYDFADHVLYRRYDHPLFYDIELIRQRMLQSAAVIEVSDYGAGSHSGSTYLKPLRQLVSRAAKNSKYARLLSAICRHYRPYYSVELGTNVGISTLYQAAALEDSQQKLFSIEGCPKLSEIAEYNIRKLGLEHQVQVIPGTFDDMLPRLLEQIPRLDYIFIDGNHRMDATLRYFELCLTKSHPQTIMVFDDIRWSSDMEACWNKISTDPRVTVSIDLFYMGVVFLRQEQQKEHFTLRF